MPNAAKVCVRELQSHKSYNIIGHLKVYTNKWSTDNMKRSRAEWGRVRFPRKVSVSGQGLSTMRSDSLWCMYPGSRCTGK